MTADVDRDASGSPPDAAGGVTSDGLGLSRRSFLVGTGLGVASLASLGMLDPLRALAASSRASAGGAVIEGINSDPESLNPLLAATNVGVICSRLLFDSLLAQSSTGQLQPALASALPTISKDGKTYTFKLRSGLKWSDGEPLTADDVVFTLNLLYKPVYAGFNSYLRSLAVNYIKSVKATSPTTVVITTKNVYAPFLLTFGQVGILPKHTLGSMSGKDLNTASFNSRPSPVNGVFQLSGSGWTTGQQILYEPNANYWRGASKLDGYVIKILQNATVLATAVRTGDVHIAGQVEASQVKSLKSVSGLNVKGIPSDETTVVGFQLRPDKPAAKFFADLKVRQALCYALNRKAMLGPATFGLAKLTDSTQPSASWAYNSNVHPKYPFDPKKAAAMLDAAGWKKGSDGIREKNGEKFAIKIATDNQHSDHVTIAQIVQDNWKAVGVDVDLTLTTFPGLIKTLITEHNFDAFIIGFNVNNQSPEPDQSNFWLSTSGANIPGYNSAQADRLMNAGLQVVDQAKRKPIYKQLQNVLANDVPALPLWFLTYTWAVNSKVKGFNVNQFQQLGNRTWMKDVSVS